MTDSMNCRQFRPLVMHLGPAAGCDQETSVLHPLPSSLLLQVHIDFADIL